MPGERRAILQRIAREGAVAKALSGLENHPTGLIRHYCLYDEQSDAVLLVMQRCRGPCVAELRQRAPSGRLPEDRVRRMLAGVAGALGVLHSLGILCVDLKAENVVLDPCEEDPDRVVLLDFDLCRDLPGHSRCEAAVAAAMTSFAATDGNNPSRGGGAGTVAAAAAADPSTTAAAATAADDVDSGTPAAAIAAAADDNGNVGTAAGRIWGTAEYLAYELLKDGPAAYSPASDWWALGVLAYELLYGRPPYSTAYGRGSLEALLQRMTTFSPAFPSAAEGGPQVSTHMQYFIRSLLRHRPDTRLGSGGGGVREVLGHPALAAAATAGHGQR